METTYKILEEAYITDEQRATLNSEAFQFVGWREVEGTLYCLDLTRKIWNHRWSELREVVINPSGFMWKQRYLHESWTDHQFDCEDMACAMCYDDVDEGEDLVEGKDYLLLDVDDEGE